PLLSSDAGSLHAAVRESIASVGRWMAWCHPEYSLREAQEWIARCESNWAVEQDREFGIFAAPSDTPLGCAGINQINRVHNFANLGYWVRTTQTGRGIATRGVRLLARFAFEELKLSRVEIVARVENLASRRVA